MRREKTDLGRAYMEWARFPLVEAEALGEPTPGYWCTSATCVLFTRTHPESYSETDRGTTAARWRLMCCSTPICG